MALEIRPSAGSALESRPQYQPTAYRSASAVAAMSFFAPAEPQPASAPAAVVRPGAAFMRMDRLAPLALSTPALVLGRIWHLHGAAHSIGDATLMGALSVGTAIVGCATTTASAVVTGTVLGLAGGLAASAVAGYAASIWPGLVLWALGTVAGYAVAWRGWRAEARRAAERAHEREGQQLAASTTMDVAMIEARRDVAVALIGAERDVQVAQIGAEKEREFAERYGLSRRAGDVDPSLFTLSPEAQAALAPSSVMKAADVLKAALADEEAA